MADSWYKCDPTDLLDAYVDLAQPELIAVYSTVLNRIYQSDGPISNSEAHIGAMVGLKPRRTRNVIDDLIARGKLQLVDGRLTNRRCEVEIDRRNTISESRSKAGSVGGKVRSRGSAGTDKPLAKSSVSHQTEFDIDVKQPRSSEIQTQETAETSHSGQASASPRLDKIRQEPPNPQKQRGRFMPDMPDFGPDDRRFEPVAEPVPIAAPAAPQPAAPEPVPINKPDLIAWIMTQAKMPVPPSDMALVGGWVEMGLDVERELKPTVCRMVAGAKTPVRGMRYFDTELRRIYDVRIAKDASDRAGFAAIRQRYAG